MSSSTRLDRNGRAIAVLAAVLLLAGCDLPTEPPRFELTTGLHAPLLVDKTFVLLGPSDTGFDALIDTSSVRFDSIFTVDASNQTIAILQELDGFEFELPEELLPTLAVDPVEVSFSADVISTSDPQGGLQDEIAFQPGGESFGEGNVVALDGADIRFSRPDDYVELTRGTLRIADLLNEFDVSFDEVLVSVPALRRAPFGPADSLVIRFEDLTDSPDDLRFHQVNRKGGPRNEEIDLSGYRLYAFGNEISYYVFGRNETTAEVRYISTSEHLRLSIRIEDIVVSALSAELEPLEVSASQDVNQDGRLDVLDDGEANVVAFEGLNVFDDIELDNVQLTGAELRAHVRSNIAADFALFAVIVGIDDHGEAFYLEGKGSNAVEATDLAAAIFSAGGAPIDPQYMIRLDLEGVPTPDHQVTRTVVLNEQNSNVDAFISRLPSELRMVARLVIQPDGGHVQLREPFLLETSFGASIPLAVSSGILLDKTFDADLSALENVASDSNDATIEEAEIELSYGNNLPLGLDLQVDFLDADGGIVTSFPKADQSMHVDPASTDASGIAMQPTEGTFAIRVSRTDLEAMSRGERIRLRFALTTDNNGPARLRATDTFTMRLRGNLRVRISAD